jgi:hypothetical protein
MFYTLLILLLISLVVNIFLLISLKRAFSQIDILEEWLIEFKLLINNTYKKLKNIDERGMFEKDDDVGIVFKNIIEIIDLTNKRIQINDDDKP